MILKRAILGLLLLAPLAAGPARADVLEIATSGEARWLSGPGLLAQQQAEDMLPRQAPRRWLTWRNWRKLCPNMPWPIPPGTPPLCQRAMPLQLPICPPAMTCRPR